MDGVLKVRPRGRGWIFHAITCNARVYTQALSPWSVCTFVCTNLEVVPQMDDGSHPSPERTPRRAIADSHACLALVGVDCMMYVLPRASCGRLTASRASVSSGVMCERLRPTALLTTSGQPDLRCAFRSSTQSAAADGSMGVLGAGFRTTGVNPAKKASIIIERRVFMMNSPD